MSKEGSISEMEGHDNNLKQDPNNTPTDEEYPIVETLIQLKSQVDFIHMYLTLTNSDYGPLKRQMNFKNISGCIQQLQSQLQKSTGGHGTTKMRMPPTSASGAVAGGAASGSDLSFAPNLNSMKGRPLVRKEYEDFFLFEPAPDEQSVKMEEEEETGSGSCQ